MTDPRGPWGGLAEPLHTDRTFSPDDPPWRENLFFTLWDRDRNFYGTSHMQGGHTDAGMWARCSIVVDGRPAEIWERLDAMTFMVLLGAAVKGAPHPDAARTWLDFIRSPGALQIFERYGFKPAIAH